MSPVLITASSIATYDGHVREDLRHAAAVLLALAAAAAHFRSHR